ncbi:hypothetical protein DAMA08_008150 [Martiniozyma asiatica (nom. inval.)]|nr:hypothetical protein DAMA08_008150 [Martiniozyma asiatica]
MFTPVESTIGALLIQSATSSYINLEGKVIGFSSIIYSAIFRPAINNLSIVFGLFLSTRIIRTFLPSVIPPEIAYVGNSPIVYGSPMNYLTAGLLVGLGSSAGCGCTSGHMLAGFSRLRWRSFIATCTFFTTGVLTNYLVGNSVAFTCQDLPCYYFDETFSFFRENAITLLGLTFGGFFWSYSALPYISKMLKSFGNSYNRALRVISGISSGVLFGCGLLIAGMANPLKVSGFLSIFDISKFDPSLAMIPLFCILPNIFLWKRWLPQTKEENELSDEKFLKKPILAKKFDLNFSDNIDKRFLIGNAIFGIGWGLAGICPGPGILSLFISGPQSKQALWTLGFLMGQFIERHTSS